MPKPMIRRTSERSVQLQGVRPTKSSPLAKVLTAPRSRRYLQALAKLDTHAGTSTADLSETIDVLHREFSEKWASQPIGFVAHCYLGHPYETHVLSTDGDIVEHYERGQHLPRDLEVARNHARSEQYLVIEVYPDRLLCVRTDGTTVTLKG